MCEAYEPGFLSYISTILYTKTPEHIVLLLDQEVQILLNIIKINCCEPRFTYFIRYIKYMKKLCNERKYILAYKLSTQTYFKQIPKHINIIFNTQTVDTKNRIYWAWITITCCIDCVNKYNFRY